MGSINGLSTVRLKLREKMMFLFTPNQQTINTQTGAGKPDHFN